MHKTIALVMINWRPNKVEQHTAIATKMERP